VAVPVMVVMAVPVAALESILSYQSPLVQTVVA
jgi:hypothetical protein